LAEYYRRLLCEVLRRNDRRMQRICSLLERFRNYAVLALRERA
jgi:hypothetical protein